MSYTLVPYLVDLESLRRAVGGNDEALLAAVIAKQPEAFAETEADDEEVSLGRALRDLVMDDPPESGSAHQYGYALEQLCDHLGERVAVECWDSIHWEVIEATGMEEILERTGPPVPLPRYESFPAIGHLTAEQVRSLAGKAAAGPLKTAAPSGRKRRRSLRAWLLGMLMARITRREPLSDADLRELLEEYEGWLREAAEKDRALVFFYY